MTDLSAPPPTSPSRARCARRAARQITCRNWLIEAAYRMIQNNLDPEVAENPDALVVYGGIGKAARNWDCFEAILDGAARAAARTRRCWCSRGKPVGVFRTHADAPRVLIANSNLVPKWATWEHFDELDRKGLMMYGQMTAGSWIYIGSQGIVQGTYETFVEAGRQHYGGDLAGRWILTAGLGGMGGAQPLAATFAGASSLNIECQQTPHRLSPALALPRRAGERPRRRAGAHRSATRAEKRAVSIGLLGNAAELAARAAEARAGRRHPARPRHRPDLGARPGQRLPAGRLDASSAGAPRRPSRRSTRALRDAAAQSCATHVQAMLDFQALGMPTVDYGNNIRQVAFDDGVDERVRLSRASCRPTSGRCSAAARGRSAGSRCRATPRTSARPTRR